MNPWVKSLESDSKSENNMFETGITSLNQTKQNKKNHQYKSNESRAYSWIPLLEILKHIWSTISFGSLVHNENGPHW